MCPTGPVRPQIEHGDGVTLDMKAVARNPWPGGQALKSTFDQSVAFRILGQAGTTAVSRRSSDSPSRPRNSDGRIQHSSKPPADASNAVSMSRGSGDRWN